MVSKHANASTGFTLVEVMVALLVLGIALPALMGQVLAQVDASAHLRDKTLASWVARDQLERLRLERRSAQSDAAMQGERVLAERSWFWTVEQEATAMSGISKHTVHVGLAQDEILVSLSAWHAPDTSGLGVALEAGP